jgi:predicted transcriptional regulator
LKRSKLETYIDIINVLARNGPMKLTHIMYKANVNCNVLKGDLGFLIKQGLVEERTIKRERVVFTSTQRGITVLNYFRQLTEMLPGIEA